MKLFYWIIYIMPTFILDASSQTEHPYAGTGKALHNTRTTLYSII